MSEPTSFDDLDGGGTGDPDPVVDPAAGDPDPAAAGDPDPATDDDDDAEGLAVEVQQGDKRVKMAPVSSIVKHRRAARAASTALEAEQRRTADLEARLRQTSGDVERLTPLLERLKDRPDLVEAAMKGTRPSSADNPANLDADPKMVQLAKDWELYDGEGKPDAARAARIATTFREQARDEAKAANAPLVNAQVQQRADTNKSLLYGWAKAGHVTKEGVDRALAMMPGAEQLLAHDGVRDVLYFMAKGMSPAAAKAAAGQPDAPIHTEAAGGRGRAPAALPRFSQQNAERRGRSSTEWSKLRDADGDVLE